MDHNRSQVTIVGRYAIHRAIASGGMATVHFGRLLGPVGFARTVALKRLHAQFASDPEFVDMLVDEARIAGRIQHPNVVQTLDVVTAPGELLLVMEYVHGQSLSRLVKDMTDRRQTIPLPIASAIITGMLHGLHAAHEAKSDAGHPLGIVHRDVSPQNVVVGVDGVARVLDFGVAKAANRLQSTRSGQLKGKLAYMSPEQLRAQPTSRLIDIYAAGIVLWEALTCQRLFKAEDEGSLIGLVLEGRVPPASSVAPHIPPALDEVIRRCVARDPAERFQTAREAARALEVASRPALASEVGDWVEVVAKVTLEQRAAFVAELESLTGLESQSNLVVPGAPAPPPPTTPAAPLARTMVVPVLPHGVPEPIDDARTIREAPSTHTAAVSASAVPLAAPPPAASLRKGSSRWIIAVIASVLMAIPAAALIVGVVVLRNKPHAPPAPASFSYDPAPPPTIAASSAAIVDEAPPSSTTTTASSTAAPPSASASSALAVRPPRIRATAASAAPPTTPSASASTKDMYRSRW